MVFDPRSPDRQTSLSLLEQVDGICRTFEQAWNTRSRVSIEQLLTQYAELPRSLLLGSLLFRELLLVNKEGRACSLGQYLTRFPDDGSLLGVIFQKLDGLSGVPPIPHRSILTDDHRSVDWHKYLAETLVTAQEKNPGEDRKKQAVIAGKDQGIREQLQDSKFPDFPGYSVSRVIGQGGMGIVYLGLDVKSKRWVALKTLRSDMLMNPTLLRRFRQEVDAYRKLSHPHIVRFLADFEHQGQPVLVLEYASAGSLAMVLQKGVTLPPQIAALMLEQLASAVAVAHHNQLLHRDITPSNILLNISDSQHKDLAKNGVTLEDMDREILQDCFDWRRIYPSLTDFGLLLALDDPAEQLSRLTAFGQLMGTPSYMAPESISPKFGIPSYQTDVYGLGACLYEAMTGKPPHVGFNIMDTMNRVVSDDIVPPRLFRKDIPSELNDICIKCLARHPRDRYASAEELHVDLVQFRSGKKLRFARQSGFLTKAFKRCRDNTSTVLWMLSTLLAGLFLTLIVYSVNRRDMDQQGKAEIEAVAREELGVMREALLSRFDLVKAVGIYASEHDDLSDEQFREFCGPLVRSHRSMKALSWATFVLQENRTEFEETASFSGGEKHLIYERDNAGERISARRRSFYVPVQFIVPWDTNQQAIGFDLASEARRLSALRRAEQQKELCITSPLQLVQDDEPVEAFLAVFPVFDRTNFKSPSADALGESTIDSVSDRTMDSGATLKGFATGVFRTRDVIEPCLQMSAKRLWLRIFDVTEDRSVVYTTPELRNLTHNCVTDGPAFSASMNNFGRTWEIEFFMPPNLRSEGNLQGPAILIAGCLLSALCTGLPLLLRYCYHTWKRRKEEANGGEGGSRPQRKSILHRW